jgi:FdhD protein
MTIQTYTGLLVRDGQSTETRDLVSVEVPLYIQVNGVPFTVTMRTPGHESDLVRGLLFSEQVYTRPTGKLPFEILKKNDQGDVEEVAVNLPESELSMHFAGKRNLVSVSSCGICGKTELENGPRSPLEKALLFPADLIPSLFAQISALQQNFHQSGGTHASGAFSSDGQLLVLREDLGRHNAVDKVIGHLLENNRLQEAVCLTVSGRISYEIVHKTHQAGIPFLASVSAPSSLAIDLAREGGITLMSFCRENKFTVYTHPENLVFRKKENVHPNFL